MDNPLSSWDPFGLCPVTIPDCIQLAKMTVIPFVNFGGGGGGGASASPQPEGDPPYVQNLLDKLQRALQHEATQESKCLGIPLLAIVIPKPGLTPNSVLIEGISGAALLSGGSRTFRENSAGALGVGKRTRGFAGEIGTFYASNSNQIIFGTPEQGLNALQEYIQNRNFTTVGEAFTAFLQNPENGLTTGQINYIRTVLGVGRGEYLLTALLTPSELKDLALLEGLFQRFKLGTVTCGSTASAGGEK